MILVVTCIVGLSAASSQGHLLWDWQRSQDPVSGRCGEGRALMNHGPGIGHPRAEGKALSLMRTNPNQGFVPCSRTNTLKPGLMLVGWGLWKWSRDRGQWELCKKSGWVKNTGTTDTLTTHRTFNNPPCGRGYYYVAAAGYVAAWGNWYGGKTHTQHHYFRG